MRPVVVTAAIIGRRGKVLITQRRPGSLLSLKWEFPGGRAKRGEELPTCLEREIAEELGVKIVVLKPFQTIQHVHQETTFQIHYFLCRITRGEPRALGVNDLRWVKPGQHNSYRILPPDKVIMKKLAKQAKNHD